MSEANVLMAVGPRTPASAPPRLVRMLIDLAERVFCLGLFGLFAFSFFNAIDKGANWYNAVIVAAEGITVVLILIRRPSTATSYQPLDLAVAFITTGGPLLVRPEHVPPIAPSVAGALILAGLIGQVWSKLTLGRSFGVVPANRGLRVSGPYRWVRHPIYLSYLLGWVGILLLYPTFWNASIYALCLAGQVFRMDAEERVLGLDPAYGAYAAQVRFRLIPSIY